MWISGSRNWSNTTRVRSVLTKLAEQDGGTAWAVGDAAGADAAAIQAVLALGEAHALTIYCVGDPQSGAGCWRQTARSTVGKAAAAGATVVPWAGGDTKVDLYARLARRSKAMVRRTHERAEGVWLQGMDVPCPPVRIIAFVEGLPPRPVEPTTCWRPCGSGTWATLALAAGLGCRALLIPATSLTPPNWSGGQWQQGCFAGGAAWAWHPFRNT